MTRCCLGLCGAGEEKLGVIAEGKLIAINFQFLSCLFMISFFSILQFQIGSLIYKKLLFKRIAAVYPAFTDAPSCQDRQWKDVLKNLKFFLLHQYRFITLKTYHSFQEKHYVSLSQAGEYCSDQGYFKPVLINTEMLDLAYNQTKSIYIRRVCCCYFPAQSYI